MPVEVALGTPLANKLNTAIQPKLVEVGWVTGGGDESALAEYIILMLVNGKTQEQISRELSGDLLGLPPDDPGSLAFTKWLFEQVEAFNKELNGDAPAEDPTAIDASFNDAGEMDLSETIVPETSESNVPTGPRSMRNGNNNRGGRDRRIIGHMNKAMDRTGDSALHRVRGQTGSERINTHGRTPPSGPRGGAARNPRGGARAANIQHGLQNMAGPPMMMGGAQAPMDVYQILEQQNQMMFQLSQQLMNNNGNNGNNAGYGHQRRGGKSLFDRVQDPNRRKGQNFNNNHHNKGGEAKAEGSGEGEDVDMGGSKREAPNPEDTVCKYNLNCTNRECKFAHQSPAAPHGAAVDVNDPCSFGAACKNRKCVGRHPSPAAKLAHQSEQDCKFFPNCQNPRCPFRHPSMPLCRNGPDCSTPNCKFTHVKTKCKFNPCLNPTCAFVHDEGQQGGFRDKVWTAENPEHVSERKFVGEEGSEELVRPEEDGMKQDQVAQDTEVIG